MNRSFALGTGLGVILGGALGTAIALAFVHQPPEQPDPNVKPAAPLDPNVRLVAEVLAKVERESARQPNAKARRRLVEDMLNAGLTRFDPYAGFLNPRDTKELDKRYGGKYAGIGAYVHSDRHGQIAITAPIAGSPAYRAGILAGDIILKVNGQSTEGMTVREAVDKITGTKGTPVVLTVLHEGAKEPVQLRIIRDEIEVDSVWGDRRRPDRPEKWDFLYDKANKIAYVRLVGFSKTTAKGLGEALIDLRSQGMRALVLDLRSNPGGLLTAALDVSNLFLDGGQVIARLRRPGKEEKVFPAQKELSFLPSAQDCPMAVLINRGSASASELVSAALQDHKRAVIIGERSFGKGSVQTLIEVENKQSRLKLTTASYCGPHGKNINRYPDSKDSDQWGIRPDPGFEVKLTDEERLRYWLDRNRRDTLSGKDPEPDPKEAKKPPVVDRMLERALEHLRAQLGKAETHKAG
jgi:carboxyl-terminal processing protease